MSLEEPIPRHCLRAAVAIVCSGAFLPSLAAPPTPGSILQQTTPPAALPTAPAPVIKLPAPTRQDEQAGIPITVREIRLEGNELIPSAELLPLLAEPLGKTVTLGELNQAASRVTANYRAHGYTLAYVYVPAQSIADGILRIQSFTACALVAQTLLEQDFLLTNQSPNLGGAHVAARDGNSTTLKHTLGQSYQPEPETARYL